MPRQSGMEKEASLWEPIKLESEVTSIISDSEKQNITKTWWGQRVVRRVTTVTVFWQSVAIYEHKRNVSLRIFFFLFAWMFDKKNCSYKGSRGNLQAEEGRDVYDCDVPDVHNQDKKFWANTWLCTRSINTYACYVCSVIFRYYLAKLIINAAAPTNRACNWVRGRWLSI